MTINNPGLATTTVSRQIFSNANVTAISATTLLAQTGTLSAPVVVSLPLASTVLAALNVPV